MKKRVYSILNPPPKFAEVEFSPSLTVPDDCMSIKEIIEHSLAGMLSDVYTSDPVDDEIPEDTFELGTNASIKDLSDFDEFIFSENKPLDEESSSDSTNDSTTEDKPKAVPISASEEAERSATE